MARRRGPEADGRVPAVEVDRLRDLEGASLAGRCRRLLDDDRVDGLLDDDAAVWLAMLAYAAELGADDQVATLLEAV